MTPTAYPLTWPGGRRRTASPRRSKFTRERSFAVARGALTEELRKLGARNVTLSTNVALSGRGTPYSGQRQPDDKGAAVFFQGVGIDGVVVLACDQWDRVEDNVFAIAMHISAMRGQERWGVGDLEQAFAGYALPAAKTTTLQSWREILNVPAGVLSVDDEIALVDVNFKALAKLHHPDRGGDPEKMALVNVARDAALDELFRAKKGR